MNEPKTIDMFGADDSPSTSKLKPKITSSRRKGPKKSSQAMKTISEVATLLGVEQHVLRFWETKFHQVKPMKRGGNRRYYRPRDVEIITRIHHFLHEEGYTIKGLQRLMKKQSLDTFLTGQTVAAPSVAAVTKSKQDKAPNYRSGLKTILKNLKQIRSELDS